jgi:uncharacterized protein YbaP (TraB family)
LAVLIFTVKLLQRSNDGLTHSRGWLIFVLLLFLVSSCATNDLAPRKVSLWKIESGAATVFLLGSVHALTPDEYPLPISMEKAFVASGQAVFEVDLASASDTDITILVRKLGMYKPPLSLQTELSDDGLILLRKHLGIKEISFDSVKQMRPWFLSLTLALQELELLKYDAELGVDQYFQRKAGALKKPILELESIESQFELLASDSHRVQELALRSSIEESSQAESQISNLIEAWRSGDADGMWRAAISESKYPELDVQIEKLIDSRNKQMVEKITEYLKMKETTLIVVGALHMGGEQGILNLLSANYAIQQMGPE